jgi:hypothetical protein
MIDWMLCLYCYCWKVTVLSSDYILRIYHVYLFHLIQFTCKQHVCACYLITFCFSAILYMLNHHCHWQNSPFSATAFNRRFCQIWPSFHFFGFYNNIYITEQGHQPCVQLQPGGLVPIFMSHNDRKTQSYPKPPGSHKLLSVTNLHQGQIAIESTCTSLKNYLPPNKRGHIKCVEAWTAVIILVATGYGLDGHQAPVRALHPDQF